MKGKFITLVLTLGFLAAFGVFMHSPPSILDGLTGATPKAKRAAQMAAPLEGNYLFCINDTNIFSNNKINNFRS